MSPSASDPIASKLLDADSELAQQEALFSAQLSAIQQKRNSLLSVLQIFGLSQPPDAAPAEPPTASPPSPAPEAPAAASEIASTPANGRRQAAKTPKATQASPKTTRQPKKEQTATKTTPTKNTAQSKKGRAATKTATSAKGGSSWQNYVRKPYRNMSLPQAVLAVMQERPNDLIEVSAILDRLFEDNIPKETRWEARDRLSNVLSVGLKNNKWFRGERATYSASQKAAEASLDK